MKTFEKSELKRLRWQQAGELAFDLRDGKETLASLQWKHAVGPHAIGRTAESEWDIERLSLFGPYIRIRTAADSVEVAHFGRGHLDEACTLRFHHGGQFVWGPLGMVDGMSFALADGKPVVDFRPYMRGDERGANLTVHQIVSELPVLLLLGWYVLEMEYREDYGQETGEEQAPAL